MTLTTVGSTKTHSWRSSPSNGSNRRSTRLRSLGVGRPGCVPQSNGRRGGLVPKNRALEVEDLVALPVGQRRLPVRSLARLKTLGDQGSPQAVHRRRAAPLGAGRGSRRATPRRSAMRAGMTALCDGLWPRAGVAASGMFRLEEFECRYQIVNRPERRSPL